MESPDFYNFIYKACHSREDSTILGFDPVLWYRADRVSENGVMVLSLGLYESSYCPPKLVLDLGMYNILNCNEESIQNNLLPLLYYIFLGLYLHFSSSTRYSVLKFTSEIRSNIIESTKYKRVFNSLFSSMCSFFSTHCGPDEEYVRNGRIPKKLMQAREETLLLIGPAGTYRFMHFLASYLMYNSVYSTPFKVSYGSSVGGFWRIASYSLLGSLEKIRPPKGQLQWNSAQHLVNCILQIGHVVNIRAHWIEVCLQIDNVTCDVLPPMDCGDPSERQFPAKICLTVGPEHGFGVQSVSLSVSTHKFKNNWGFEQSIVNGTDAKLDWTLYDSTTGKPAYSTELPMYSSVSGRYFKACRAFTEQRAVVFAKDDYGKPIIWRLGKDLKEKTVKWIVKASIWFDCSLQSDLFSHVVRRHDFQHVLDLKLETTSTSN